MRLPTDPSPSTMKSPQIPPFSTAPLPPPLPWGGSLLKLDNNYEYLEEEDYFNREIYVSPTWSNIWPSWFPMVRRASRLNWFATPYDWSRTPSRDPTSTGYLLWTKKCHKISYPTWLIIDSTLYLNPWVCTWYWIACNNRALSIMIPLWIPRILDPFIYVWINSKSEGE